MVDSVEFAFALSAKVFFLFAAPLRHPWVLPVIYHTPMDLLIPVVVITKLHLERTTYRKHEKYFQVAFGTLEGDVVSQPADGTNIAYFLIVHLLYSL